MKVTIFIEGAAKGPDSKALQVRCREGFHKLLARCRLPRQPALKACGSRGKAYRMFVAAHTHAPDDHTVLLLVDSEVPVMDIEQTWQHLQAHDGWQRPAGSRDEQVLFMTTCMETWLVADREALQGYFGPKLRIASLPKLHALESRGRQQVQRSLILATKPCQKTFAKGSCAFELLALLDPTTLRKLLPSFARCERILRNALPPSDQ